MLKYQFYWNEKNNLNSNAIQTTTCLCGYCDFIQIYFFTNLDF